MPTRMVTSDSSNLPATTAGCLDVEPVRTLPKQPSWQPISFGRSAIHLDDLELIGHDPVDLELTRTGSGFVQQPGERSQLRVSSRSFQDERRELGGGARR